MSRLSNVPLPCKSGDLEMTYSYTHKSKYVNQTRLSRTISVILNVVDKILLLDNSNITVLEYILPPEILLNISNKLLDDIKKNPTNIEMLRNRLIGVAESACYSAPEDTSKFNILIMALETYIGIPDLKYYNDNYDNLHASDKLKAQCWKCIDEAEINNWL
jgi:hypothetical protein